MTMIMRTTASTAALLIQCLALVLLAVVGPSESFTTTAPITTPPMTTAAKTTRVPPMRNIAVPYSSSSMPMTRRTTALSNRRKEGRRAAGAAAAAARRRSSSSLYALPPELLSSVHEVAAAASSAVSSHLPTTFHVASADLPTLQIASESATASLSATSSTAVSSGTAGGGAGALEALGRDIFTFLAASVLVVPTSKYLKLSPVLGFLLIGCLIGPYGIALFANTAADVELGDFGILFLLFNEGLALSPSRIDKLTSFSSLGLLQLFLTIALFFFGTIFAGPLILQVADQFNVPLDEAILQPILASNVQAFCIASAGALSSSAFVLPVLKSKKWEEKPEGIAGLSILLLQDLAVAPLLVMLPILAGSGPQTATELGLLVFKATVGFGGVLALGRFALDYVFEFVAAARSTETFVAAALLVAVGMGQAADWLGLSASTGAFAAGVLLAGNRFRPQIQADIKPFEGILLGIFFMTAGAGLDPTVVIKEWPTLTIGIAAFVVSKAAILLLEGPALGLTAGQAARVALTLSGGGEFSFVLFKLAQDLGVLPEQLAKLLTASVIISMSLTPLLAEVGDKVGTYLDENYGSSEIDENGNRLQFVGRSISTDEAQALFDKIDSDGSGTIELNELRDVLVKRGLKYGSIADIFTAFDTDRSGTICREEWETGLKAGIIDAALLAHANDATEPSVEFDPDAIVIAGFSEYGKMMYEMLSASGNTEGSIVAFDLNPSRVTAGVLSGHSVVFGDCSNIDLLRAAGIRKPKAVILTFVSQSRQLDATLRLRETLPAGTPIYARTANGRLGQQELDAGATEVICDTTESVLRIGSLLGVANSVDDTARLRKILLDDLTEWEVVPGLSEDALVSLAERAGISRQDVANLYDVFLSLVQDGQDEVPIADLRDTMLRLAGDGPIDADALTNCMLCADEDGGGRLTFSEFVQVACLPPVPEKEIDEGWQKG